MSRRARLFIVPGVFLLQVGVAVLMGPDFTKFLICYLFWIPWARLGTRAKGRMRERNKHVFLFDGACGLCQRTVAVLRALDVLDRIVFYDAIRDWPTVRERFPVLHQQDCIETVHVVTSRGRVEAGFEAYRALSWSLPLLWLAAPLLYLPGVPWVGRRVYAAVAARRHRTGCPVVPSRS